MSNARVLNADCPFCAILHDGAPATILRRGIHSLVIRPLGPVTEGHVIAIPYEHVSDAATDPHVTANTMGDLAVYAGILRSQGELGDFNIITSAGPTATQSVYHLHLHLVPRHHRDGLALPWHSGKHKETRPNALGADGAAS